MGASSSIKRKSYSDNCIDKQLTSIGLADAKSSRKKMVDPPEMKESLDSSLLSSRIKVNTKFMDSTFIEGWLSTKEATYLYDYLKQIGDKQVLSLSYAYSSHHDDY